MDLNLQEDLVEALEGLDPLELLLEDPSLADLAEEVCRFPEPDLDCDEELIGTSDSDGSDVTTLTKRQLKDHGLNLNNRREDEVNTKKKKRFKNKKALCRICERLSHCHNYYGATTCNSCRAFFARASKNNAHDSFVCTNSNYERQCVIDSASWKSCKKCRYSKCQRMGMKLASELVNIENVHEVPYFFAIHMRMSLSFYDTLTEDETSLLRDITFKRIKLKMEHRRKFHLKDINLYKEGLELLYNGRPVSLKSFKSWEDFLIYGQVQAFMEGELNSDRMTKKDRLRLLMANLKLVNEFFEAYCVKLYENNFDDVINYHNIVIRDLDLMQKECYNEVHSAISENGRKVPNGIR